MVNVGKKLQFVMPASGTSYATVGVPPASMKLVPFQAEADFSREDLAKRQKILSAFVMRGRLGDR
jgi:hypothetical protein